MVYYIHSHGHLERSRNLTQQFSSHGSLYRLTCHLHVHVLNVPACALRSSLPNSCTYILYIICSLLWNLISTCCAEVEYCVFCVQVTLFLGQLNAIAPIVTMFFLVSYCVVNLACLALKLAAAPNFRYDEQHCGPVHVLCICGHVLLYTWELLTDCLHVHVHTYTFHCRPTFQVYTRYTCKSCSYTCTYV